MLHIVSIVLRFFGVVLLSLFALILLGLFKEFDSLVLAIGIIVLGMPGGFFMYWGKLAATHSKKLQEKKTMAEACRKAAAVKAKAEAEAKAEAQAKAEAEAEAERAAKFERLIIEARDADSQDRPYEYQCIGHPNVTLALRYGIANTSRSSGGESGGIRGNTAIRLQKIEKVQQDEAGAIYLAELPDFGGRRVKVVIRPGTEFVQTFLPMSCTWFKEHEDLERLLKDNPTFTLKELATFHVQAVLNAKR